MLNIDKYKLTSNHRSEILLMLLLKYSFILWLNQKNFHFLSGNTGLFLEPEQEPKLWTKVEPKKEPEPKINNFGYATLVATANCAALVIFVMKQ